MYIYIYIDEKKRGGYICIYILMKRKGGGYICIYILMKRKGGGYICIYTDEKKGGRLYVYIYILMKRKGGGYICIFILMKRKREGYICIYMIIGLHLINDIMLTNHLHINLGNGTVCYIYTFLVCQGVCIQQTPKRLKGSDPNLVWDLKWPLGRTLWILRISKINFPKIFDFYENFKRHEKLLIRGHIDFCFIEEKILKDSATI